MSARTDLAEDWGCPEFDLLHAAFDRDDPPAPLRTCRAPALPALPTPTQGESR